MPDSDAPMTPTGALDFLYHEFVLRFGYSAEGCCEAQDTRLAVDALATAVGVESPATDEAMSDSRRVHGDG